MFACLAMEKGGELWARTQMCSLGSLEECVQQWFSSALLENIMGYGGG
jgi:hypothetical protein